MRDLSGCHVFCFLTLPILLKIYVIGRNDIELCRFYFLAAGGLSTRRLGSTSPSPISVVITLGVVGPCSCPKKAFSISLSTLSFVGSVLHNHK